MLILPDVTEEEIRRMLAKVRADYILFGKQKKNRAFTFSCGVEQFADGMDVSDVYRQADEKLYLMILSRQPVWKDLVRSGFFLPCSCQL